MSETERKFQSNVADQLMRKILSHTESSMLWSCNDLLSLSEAIRRELNAAHAEDQNRIRDLESQLAEAERILRLTCARVCGHDTGDQTLEFLKKEQSPELADIAIAIDLGMTTQFATARREAMEECQAIDPYNIVCPICSADIQVACQEGCSRFMRYRTAIRARLKELESG